MKILRYCAVFYGLFLASCTTATLEELRHTAPKGTPLQIALAREYLAFAEDEAANYDWVDSHHFADKGLRAAYGQEVLPENLTEWELSPKAQKELQGARDALQEKLADEGLRSHKADTLARAQYFFDCWVEEQEENWQPEALARCRDGFYSTMEVLQPSALDEIEVTRSTAYMLFFDHSRAVLTPEGLEVVYQILQDWRKARKAPVLLHGHTDTSGGQEGNMKLSEARAKAVMKALVEGGVPKKSISYFAFGETDLRIPTADGIREPGNRRVEIFLE